MKIKFLKHTMFGLLLIAGLTLSSCGKNNNQSEGAADGNDAVETDSGAQDNDPVMDTVTDGNDTVVKTGGGPNVNPVGEQEP